MKLYLAKIILELSNFDIKSISFGIIFATAEDHSVQISYSDTAGCIRSIEYYNGSGQADRCWKLGAAKVYFDKNQTPIAEEYWSNGLLHRPKNTGPAVTIYGAEYKREEYWENGIQIYSEPLYCKI